MGSKQTLEQRFRSALTLLLDKESRNEEARDTHMYKSRYWAWRKIAQIWQRIIENGKTFDDLKDEISSLERNVPYC